MIDLRCYFSTNLYKLLSLMLIGFNVLTITGCVDTDISDLDKYIREINARPKGSIEPLPEIKIVESFVFEPVGLRDPFKPVEMTDSFEDNGLGELRPDTARRKEELESYALNTLQMVGTLSLNSELWGLIRLGEGSGTVHRVRVGNYMGKNNGKIVRISENDIELVEIVPDKEKSGLWVEQQASLVLAE